MYRRNRERRYHHRRRDNYNNNYDYLRRNRFASALRRPATQMSILAVVALIIFIILQVGGMKRNTVGVPKEISVAEALLKYQQGAFFLDVRTPEEWNEFHAPNSTLIPLDQLPSRLSELPKDKEIVVVCRSGNRSQQGRDILLNAGFTQVTSMAGGLNEWRAAGYPVTP